MEPANIEHKAQPSENPGSSQPPTPPEEASTLTRHASVSSNASAFPLLAGLLDCASAASADLASTMTPAPYPAPIATFRMNPAVHPTAFPGAAVDSAAHVISPTVADGSAGPCATAAAAEPKNENSLKPFTWKTDRARLERQEATTRQAPRRRSPPRRYAGDQQNTSVVRGTYYATAYPCDTCRYHFDVRLDRREAIVNWFRDADNVDQHVFFILSLLLAISLTMSLTFAWLEGARRMANAPLLLTVPLGVVFAAHSLLWASLSLYCLWCYPKAFWRWKNQTLPLVARHFLRMTTASDPAADQEP